MSDLKIAVLGAGVVGLTTAAELQKRFRNANIQILAANFLEDTTSAVAAGIFRPSPSFCGPNENVTRKWIYDSYYYWDEIRKTAEGALAGVVEVSGYIFSSEHPKITRNQYLEQLVPLYRKATEEELTLCPGDWKYGAFYTTLVTECGEYLPWISKKLKASGVTFVNKSVTSFTDISKDYDVIVNCTGLGAKYLCDDNKLVPIRGQVLKVKAPWIKTFFYGDYDTYVIPGLKSVTLGGCRQYESYDCTIQKYDSMSIKERCEQLVPSLKNADLIGEKVGLRPHRDPVRVEKEIKCINGSNIKIVHNYGHGGYGVTTAPGTSLHAVELVRELLTGNSRL